MLLTFFSELEADEVSSIISINNLFCGLHVVANLGTVAKDALKEFEQLAAENIVSPSHYNTSNAHCFDVLYQTSKAFTQGHGYQKAGVVHFWEPFLGTLEVRNHFVNFSGERINILFVAGGAAYFHRQHVSAYINKHHPGGSNRLLFSLKDIDKTL